MCKQLQRLPYSIGNLKSLQWLLMKETTLTHLPDSFGMLTNLVKLDMERRPYLNGATGDIIPNKQEPKSKAILRSFCNLKKLLLSDCRELMFLPPLPSSLEELNLANCIAVQYMPDISNLKLLEELNLTNCEKVVDIPGLEHLKSLRRLYINGCIGCSLAVERRFTKVLLKKLEILIMPGSRVPDWFTAESVVFSKQRNRELKGIICSGVLSFNDIPYI